MRREDEMEEDFDGSNFTADERKRLRGMLRSHERAAWLWSTLGIWVKWIGAVLAAMVAVKVLIWEALKGVGK